MIKALVSLALFAFPGGTSETHVAVVFAQLEGFLTRCAEQPFTCALGHEERALLEALRARLPEEGAPELLLGSEHPGLFPEGVAVVTEARVGAPIFVDREALYPEGAAKTLGEATALLLPALAAHLEPSYDAETTRTLTASVASLVERSSRELPWRSGASWPTVTAVFGAQDETSLYLSDPEQGVEVTPRLLAALRCMPGVTPTAASLIGLHWDRDFEARLAARVVLQCPDDDPNTARRRGRVTIDLAVEARDVGATFQLARFDVRYSAASSPP